VISISTKITVRAGRLEGIDHVQDAIRNQLKTAIRDIFMQEMAAWVKQNVPKKDGDLQGGFLGEMELSRENDLVFNLPILPYAWRIERATSVRSGVTRPWATGVKYIEQQVDAWVKRALDEVGLA
jgi:hypothetical protein